MMNNFEIISHELKMRLKDIVKSEISYFQLCMHFHHVLPLIHRLKTYPLPI